MTDAREALVARQREEYGESWDVLVPEVGWTLGRIIESVIEDALAEFDRWLAQHDAEVRAQALREAAAGLHAGVRGSKCNPACHEADQITLRLRADWIEKETDDAR